MQNISPDQERTAEFFTVNANLKEEIAEGRPANEPLRQTTDMLSALIHASPLAIALLDPDLTVRTWNPAAERIFGWTSEELIGRPYPLVPEERQEEFRLRYAMVARGEAFSGFETVRRRKDGSEVAVSISVAPLLDARGALRAIVTFFADITEPQHAEAERERSAERLRRLQAVTDTALAHLGIQELPRELLHRIRGALDADTASVLLVDEAGDHLVLIASEGLREIEDTEKGIRIPVGHGFAGIIAETRKPMMLDDVSQIEVLSPFLRSRVRSLLGVPMVLEDRVIGVVHVGTVRFRRFTDADADLLQLVADRLALVIQQGQLYERERQARAAAEAAEQRAAFLADASKLQASTLDYEATLNSLARLTLPSLADWCVVDVFGEDHSIRRMAAAHVDSAMEERLRAAWQRYPLRLDSPHPIATALRLGRPEVVPEIPNSLLDGIAEDAEHLELLRLLGPQSLMVVPLLARGRTLGAITFVSRKPSRRYGPAELALAEDLARRAALAVDNALLYREAQEADRRKDEFLAMLAHELRNPLGAITNAVAALPRLPSADEQSEPQWAIIARQTHNLVRLVDDLLDVARIRSGKITLQRDAVDLKEVARRCLESLQASGKAGRHEVSLSVAAGPVVVQGDPVRLGQVIGNLVDNAVKYSPSGSPIRLSLDREADHAVIRVRDSGIGMSPSVLTRVFDLFVQAPGGQDRRQGGLGIGLTVVRRLVELHGGSVAALSQGPGQGSEFIVRLPLLRSRDQSASAPPLPKAVTPRRILVVEDHDDSRAGLRVLLELDRHQVAEANDGAQALAIALIFRPDVALIDIGLPGMDGYELARQLRATAEGRHVLLVALTGYGQSEDLERARQAGFDAHLLKPIKVDHLAKVLSTDPAGLAGVVGMSGIVDP